MSDFDSLTLALEGSFEASLCDLPDSLRQRVKQEFAPMPWDQLSAEQRRSVTLQVDYKHDPATEKDRQFWWDHFWRQEELTAQIAQWEVAAAPTAGELALRETRLNELRQELASTEAHERQARGDYYPERRPLDGESETSSISQGSPVQYVAYPKAIAQLRKRLDATPEELAAWIWAGPKDGGIAAYVNANELEPPPRFYFRLGSGEGDDHDYVSPLMACWFREANIARFDPVDRYITGDALIARWSDRPGVKAAAFIRAKIRESRLSDLHPMYGSTQGGWPEDASFPPMTTALFKLSDVETIEAEDFAVDWEPTSDLQPSSAQAVDLDSLVVNPANASTDAPSSAVKVPSSAAGPIELSNTYEEPAASRSPCSVFLAMPKLAATELSIVFVGDRADFVLGANNMVAVSARSETRRVPLAALDLVDRRKGGLNSQGLILIGMAKGQRLAASPQNSAKMKRLRDVMRKHFGLAGDPFEPYRKGAGWVPLFDVIDKRGAADERAKRETERKTVSYEQMIERRERFTNAESSQQGSDDELDPADEWLENNDPDARA